MRIISICPSNTELVAHLGLTEQLVGVDDFSDYPSRVKTLPQLGSDLAINMGRVKALAPDIVIASLSVPGMERNVQALEAAGLPHLILNGQSLADIQADLAAVAAVCGVTARARVLNAQIDAKVAELKAIAATVSPLSVYWEWWPKPIFTPGGVNWLTEISELAGARNIFADRAEASLQESWETVVARDPDKVLMAWVGVAHDKMKPALIKKRPQAAQMTAVQQDAIHLLEEHLYCRPSLRLIEGAVRLGKLLHPTAYAHVTVPDWLTT